MIIIGSDSEIMYFPPSFHFKKGLAKFTIEVRLIRGFRQKGAFSALSRGASYTRMRLIPEYIRYLMMMAVLVIKKNCGVILGRRDTTLRAMRIPCGDDEEVLGVKGLDPYCLVHTMLCQI